MNHLARLALIAVLMIPQGGLPLLAGEASRQGTSGGITEISLERTWCFGSCPVDTLLLRADGTAEYTGMENTHRTGLFTGKFWTGDFDQLSQWLVSEGYFELKASYGSNSVDAPSTVIRVTRGGERKSVVNYAMQRSLQLWALENVIRAVASDIQWQAVHSGISGQFLWKEPDGDWRPQPGSLISISPGIQGSTPSGMRQKFTVTTDDNGKFEIALAPGPYDVSYGFGQRPSQAVIVEPGKLTIASIRFESENHTTQKTYTPPPPPPGDGLYRYALLTPAIWLYRNGNETINLGEKTQPSIQDKQLWSDSKDNTTFRLGLATPYDPAISPVSHILIVGGKAYRQSGSGSKGRETSYLQFQITGDENARQVAGYFGTPVRYFHDPGYEVQVSLTPARKSFARGEKVIATLKIHNPGTKAVEFSGIRRFGDRYDYYTLSARRNGQPVTDISFSETRGGNTFPYGLLPGATFEEEVNLDEWFEFRESGSYDIHGSFRLEFSDSQGGSWSSVHWTDTAEADFRVVVD